MDRAPKDLGVRERTSEREVRQVIENLCLWSVSGARMTIFLSHKDVQS